MALIHISDLIVRSIIGMHREERLNRQELVIHIKVEYDATKAGRSDSIKDALDYSTLSKKVARLAERSKDYLLERLAVRLLKAILEDKRVQAAWVRLDKPHALTDAKCVSFELSAQKGEKL